MHYDPELTIQVRAVFKGTVFDQKPRLILSPAIEINATGTAQTIMEWQGPDCVASDRNIHAYVSHRKRLANQREKLAEQLHTDAAIRPEDPDWYLGFIVLSEGNSSRPGKPPIRIYDRNAMHTHFAEALTLNHPQLLRIQLQQAKTILNLAPCIPFLHLSMELQRLGEKTFEKKGEQSLPRITEVAIQTTPLYSGRALPNLV